MGWITLLEQDQLEVVVDEEKKYMMLETNSGGAIPSYVTVHMDKAEQIDALIGALTDAKKRLGLF